MKIQMDLDHLGHSFPGQVFRWGQLIWTKTVGPIFLAVARGWIYLNCQMGEKCLATCILFPMRTHIFRFLQDVLAMLIRFRRPCVLSCKQAWVKQAGNLWYVVSINILQIAFPKVYVYFLVMATMTPKPHIYLEKCNIPLVAAGHSPAWKSHHCWESTLDLFQQQPLDGSRGPARQRAT